MSDSNSPTFRDRLHGVESGTKNTLGDFKKFILRGNVVDLAVGIVIGTAFTNLVNAFVKDIITPLVPAANSKNGLSGFTYHVPLTYITFGIGDFVNTVISFLILAFVVYFFVVKPVTYLMSLHKTKPADAPTTRDCPYCLSSVPIKATKCAYCTSELPPGSQTTPAMTQRG